MDLKVNMRGFASIAATILMFSQTTFANVKVPTDYQRREDARAAFKELLFATSAQGRNPRFDDFTVNEHLTFATRADAFRFAGTLLERFKKGFNDPNIRILQNDPRYQVLDSYVQELWTAFTALFPEHTAGLNSPPVILLDSKVSNAFVTRTTDNKQVAHAIFVFTAMLDQFTINGQLNKDMVTAVIGHELAHSVFLHGLPKYQKRVNHFFNRSKLPFGYFASKSPDTAALDEAMSGWLNGALLVGELTGQDLRGLPSPGVGRSILMGAFKQMQTDAINETCAEGKAAYANWRGFVRYSVLKSALEIVPQEARPPGSDTTLANLGQASDNLAAKDRACVGSTKFSVIELSAKAFAIPLDVLKASELFVKFDLTMNTAPDAITGFQQIVTPIREEMKKVETNVDFSTLGYYTYEEHADEVSALLHTFLNRRPDALGSAFMVFMKEGDEADATTCAGLISSQTEPPNGSFGDPHRALCYRMYHLGKFSQAIGTDVKTFAKTFIDTSIGMSGLNQVPVNTTPRFR